MNRDNASGALRQFTIQIMGMFPTFPHLFSQITAEICNVKPFMGKKSLLSRYFYTFICSKYVQYRHVFPSG